MYPSVLDKPKGIVFTNDHVFYSRALIKHAKSYGIKCLYMQHSAVTEIFPPMLSQYALLDGVDSYNKY